MLCSLGDREDPDPRTNAVPDADDSTFRSRADEFDTMFTELLDGALSEHVLYELRINATVPCLLEGMPSDLHFISTDIHNIL